MAKISLASPDRPVLTECLIELASGMADVLMVSHLSRLSRSVGDFAVLLDLARAEQWKICIGDLGLDMSTSQGEMMAGVLSVFAQFQRRLLGELTKAGMQAAKAQGVKFGPPILLPVEVRDRIRSMRSTGMTYTAFPVTQICPLQVGDPVFSETLYSEMGDKRQFAIDVAFYEPGVIECEPALPVLVNFANLVQRTIAAFAPLISA